MNKKVLTKWGTEGDLAVIYQVDDILLFYVAENDPHFKKWDTLTLEEAEKTRPYKAIPYSLENVPPDAILNVSFLWKY